MTKVLITGGTGLVGRQLQKQLIDKNYEVRILTRKPKEAHEFKWDIKNNFIAEKAFDNLDYIIHLAGAGIADKRWTKARKKEILESRTRSTNLLFDKVTTLRVPLKGFISASAIGYYGAITTDKIFTEDDTPADDFLGQVCSAWENSVAQIKNAKIPTTILRTGVVLTKSGGALAKMKTPIISPIGSGKQYIPWIHVDDLCEMYIQAIEGKLGGIYNAVAPEHQTSTSFSKQLAKTINKPYLGINVPAFVLKIAFGELANLLLKGSRISSKKIEATGFLFQFPILENALNDLHNK